MFLVREPARWRASTVSVGLHRGGSSLDRLAVPAAMWSLVIVLGIAAVVAVHRHRRGAASLPAALVLLAAAPVAAMAAERIARVPLPFFF